MSARYCPDCSTAITEAEHQRGFCPGCDKPLPALMISLPSSPTRPRVEPRNAPASRDVYRDAPRSVERKGARGASSRDLMSWGATKAALTQITVSGFMLILGVILTLVMMTGGGGRGGDGMIFVISLMQIFLVLGLMGLIWGALMMVTVPDSSGAKGSAVGLAIFLSIFIVFSLFVSLSPFMLFGGGMGRMNPSTSRIMMYVCLGIGSMAYLSGVLTMARISSYCRHQGVAVTWFVCFAICMVVFWGLVFFGDKIVRSGPMRRSGDPGYLFLILFVCLTAWNLIMAICTRGAISREVG